MPTTSPAMAHDRLEQLARRRAGAKMGWYIHALVFVLVNTGLAAIALAGGRSWYAYPLFGWGLGLAIHGASVWLLAPGSRWREDLVARERAALQRQLAANGAAHTPEA